MFENTEREDLESLMHGNTEFRQLYHKHRELDDKVRDAELGVLPMDVVTLHTLKKEKLLAKDRLTHMWEHRRHPSAAH
ncbi:MAG: YdcH family protein [Dokdonella sp.]|uniref:YdcH family protein n=1 Tax=Dokdonella sp. TaxID=2291710 RepID=UPI002CB22D19|nr:YdcH family protein [Dokdonella sp.]HOX72093.1 YdcH family protein [Dokdonella sp.]HPN80484.1 YdcH family protein [Dokdonella sp.]